MENKNEIDIRALAQLARLDVSDEELMKLEEQLPAILGFVGSIQEVAEGGARQVSEHRNIMRDDVNPHESGAHSQELLSAAPRREGDYVKVPQVIKGGKHS